MTPTEKHRETADDVYDNLARGHNLDGISRHDIVLAFAFALAKAEREGRGDERRRCADLLAAVTGIFRRCGIENDWTALIETLSTAVLSEAGKGE